MVTPRTLEERHMYKKTVLLTRGERKGLVKKIVCGEPAKSGATSTNMLTKLRAKDVAPQEKEFLKKVSRRGCLVVYIKLLGLEHAMHAAVFI